MKAEFNAREQLRKALAKTISDEYSSSLDVEDIADAAAAQVCACTLSLAFAACHFDKMLL